MKKDTRRWVWLGLGSGLLGILVVMSLLAPENLSMPVCSGFKRCIEGPLQHPPFGTDTRGIPLLEYVMQGAKIVTLPAIISGLLVAFLSTIAGLARCASLTWVDTIIQAVSEIMGALPEIVVVLVIALAIPREWRGLLPIDIAWALMSTPGAMDEAASCAGRLEVRDLLRPSRRMAFRQCEFMGIMSHGLIFEQFWYDKGQRLPCRLYFRNCPVLPSRTIQGPAFTHSDSTYSWAELLYFGYQSIISGEWYGEDSLMHAMVVGLGFIVLTAFIAHCFRLGARER